MKTEKRWCKDCNRETPHDYWRRHDSAVERIFLGIVTMGVSEACNDHIYQCQCCGKRTVRG